MIEARVTTASGVRVERASFMVWNERPADRELRVSATSDRRNPVPLDGRSISSPIAVFVPREPDVVSVAFFLDDVLVRTERFAPYDFAGTAGNGRARLFDPGPGERRIRAVITFTDGTTDELDATFTRT